MSVEYLGYSWCRVAGLNVSAQLSIPHTCEYKRSRNNFLEGELPRIKGCALLVLGSIDTFIFTKFYQFVCTAVNEKSFVSLYLTPICDAIKFLKIFIFSNIVTE